MDQKYFILSAFALLVFKTAVSIGIVGNVLQLWNMVNIINVVFLLIMALLTIFLKMQKNQKIVLMSVLSFIILYLTVPRLIYTSSCGMMYTGPIIYISILSILFISSFLMDVKNKKPKDNALSAITLLLTFFILSIVLSFEYICF